MTTWDWLRGDAENEDREAPECQACGAALSGDLDADGLILSMKAVGLCQACADDNLPALCAFCNGALGRNGAPNGFGDPICDSCLETYHRDHYREWCGMYAWETQKEYAERMDSPATGRLRFLADAEKAAGGNRAAVHAAEEEVRRQA